MNPILALIIANIIWGAASPIFKFALQNIPPFTLAFVRFFFASLILLPLAIRRWQKFNVKQLLEIIMVGFGGITVSITFFFLGLSKTTSINAPVIASSGPVFLYFLSIVFLKEKPKLKTFLGMVISLFGVLVIIFSPILLDGRHLNFGEIEGNLFFVLATLGAVFAVTIQKDLSKKINPYVITFVSFVFGSLTFLPFIFSELSRWSFVDLNINGWSGIIFGVFFSSTLAYLLFCYGLSKIQASEAGLFYYIDPIVAILIAIPLLGEYPNLYFFAGSILVAGGIFLAEGRIHWHPLHKLKVES